MCGEMWLKVVGLVLVEAILKARQGGVCGEMWLKAVGLVLVEAVLKARQGGNVWQDEAKSRELGLG